MEVVIKKGGKKRKHLFIKNEEIKLENEVVILKLSLEWCMDDHMKDSKNSPIYKVLLLIIIGIFLLRC
jgi:hypothetical protein